VDLHVTFEGRRDLAGQIYRQLRGAVLDGRLRPGEGLPSTRELAERLGVSRNTVTGAYDRLMSEGFLSGRVGAGTFVADAIARPPPSRRAPAGADLRAIGAWDTIAADASPLRDPAYDFRVGVPDARMFPFTTWRRLVARELYPPRARAARYGDPQGEIALRESIARHIGLARSVHASADDVIITAGAQQAFDLVGRVLLEPGACVAVEDPGYPMVRLALASHRARVVPVPVDAEGLVVDALPASARLVYVTPSHQFPMGSAMSLERRMALLAWAERRKSVILEDDYDSEFRFAGRALEPLQALDRSGRVLYVGSFSKVLLPDLRLGYIVAPKSLRRALTAARLIADSHGAIVTQVALARFMDEGAFARHLRKARREYQARRARVEAALLREVGASMVPIPAVAGLHVSALFRDPGVDARAVALRAAEAGIAVRAIAHFAVGDDPPSGLVLGFGGIAGSRIDEGVRRLAACIGPRRARSSGRRVD
jgi:GntR family transcriptional regulator/MocR family aminotransferase